MANPQVEQGFTTIANTLLDALPRARCNVREHIVLISIIRLTYGWNKKTDAISAGQISKATGIDRRNVQHVLAELERRRFITVERQGGRRCSIIGIQKDYELWLETDVSRDASSDVSPDARLTDVSTDASDVSVNVSADVSTDPLQRQKTQRRGESASHLLAEAGRNMSPKRLERLRQIRPRGILYTEQQVAAWFVMVAPKMEALSKRDLYKTAINWFARARPEEIEEAERAQKNRSFQDNRGTNGSGKAPEKPAMAPGETFVISPERLKASGDSSV